MSGSRVSQAYETVDRLKAFHASGATQSLAFRTEKLRALAAAIEARESEILDALHADLRKPRAEAYASEIGFVLSDIAHALRRLSRWVRPIRCRSPLLTWPSRGSILPEPRGVVLVIGPWNYPFQLLLSPLVGAIAAGNCVCLKPSEFAPATTAAVAEMLGETFSADYINVVEGGPDETNRLIDSGFDQVFFTGSSAVGRLVMQRAAQQLTPVTLELGGKSPCIVCNDVDVNVAARRILWGKCMNAGQTCVAPDYAIVDARVCDSFWEALKRSLENFYGEDARYSPDYGRIVNLRHFERLTGYLSNGRIVCGGEYDARDLYIAPTVLTDVPASAPVMQEEIFGPILPVIPFEELGEVTAYLRERPTPLALYLFTEDRRLQERILAEVRSGGACINDTVSHIFGKNLPFGGVGASGMGSYHGKASFDCFTHYRSVLRRRQRPDPGFRYPPTRHKLETMKRLYGLLMRC